MKARTRYTLYGKTTTRNGVRLGALHKVFSEESEAVAYLTEAMLTCERVEAVIVREQVRKRTGSDPKPNTNLPPATWVTERSVIKRIGFGRAWYEGATLLHPIIDDCWEG